jgi:glycosyltransferase involved in cell wall biosynthesis
MTERKPVVLIEHIDREDSEKSGMGVYGRSVKNLLDGVGAPYIKLGAMIPKESSVYLRWLLFGLPKLLMRIRKLGSNVITHVAWEAYGFITPFIRGKRIVTFHHVLSKNDFPRRTWYFLWKIFARMAIANSDIILAVSPRTRDDLINMLGVPESKIRIVLNKPSDAYYTVDGVERDRLVGFVGSLTKRKNIGLLIRSFKKVCDRDGMSDIRLKIIGQGEEGKPLRDLANSLNIGDRVDFDEYISVEDLRMFYNRMMVFANPSLREGFGAPVMEAQRCSAPVIFLKHAEIPAEVTKAAVGCEDEDEFADVMYRLLTDKEYWTEVSEKGKAYATAFGDEYAEKMLSLYFE